MKKSTSIQKKLLRVIMLVAGAVLFLTSAAFFVYEYITYRDITKRELQILGQITASNSAAALYFENKTEANELLKALKAQKHLVAACLFDKNGKLFVSYPQSMPGQYIPAGIGATGYHFRGKSIEGFEPVTRFGKRIGTLYLLSDTKAIYDRFILYGIIAVTFTAISFLFAYLFSERLQGAISNPILDLADKARFVSDKGDYSIRAENKTNDEIGVLTDSFNHMLTQIQKQTEEINTLNANLEEKILIRTKELQKANETLSKQNEFIQTIIDSSVHVIAVFDMNLNYLIVNRQSELVYKKTKDELIGKNLLELYPMLKGSVFIDNINRAFNGELVHQELYKSLASNRFFENFFIPLRNEQNQIDRVLAIAHDITAIVKTNEELKQLNSELEKSNRDLEQFAYVASHDLQEPLRKIQIFSELSGKNLNEPETAQQYLGKIQSSANRMSGLIKAVLNYSRLSGKDSQFTDVDLSVIINNIIVDLELLIREKNAVIKVDPLPVVRGLALQINQLFLNLFLNSLKFTERQPEITIRSSFISAEQATSIGITHNDNSYVEIVFADNGIGFDQQYAAQVFSIFQRLHPSDKYEGTGIGLALCKKIVENHNGQIVVNSKAGEGTTFFIYLPAFYSSEHIQRSDSNNVVTKQ